MYTLHAHSPNAHTLTLSHMYIVIPCLAEIRIIFMQVLTNHHNENVVTGIVIVRLYNIVESVTCFKALVTTNNSIYTWKYTIAIILYM